MTESFDVRVLGALAAGATTPPEIAAGLTTSPELVQGVLDRAVASEAVSRLDGPAGASYALTPKGRQALGLLPTSGPVSPPQPQTQTQTQTQTQPPPDLAAQVQPQVTGADEVPVGPVVVPQVAERARGRVRWYRLGYAAAYVLVGLFLLLLQPVVGVLAMLAGLGIAGYTLLPLFRSGVTTR